MCRYLFEYSFLFLLAASASWAILIDEAHIDKEIEALEDRLKQNTNELLKLEAKLQADRYVKREESELCCENYIEEKQDQLSDCQAKSKAEAVKLKENDNQISVLIANLTSCRINLMDWLDQPEVGKITKIEVDAELSLKLKANSEEIRKLTELNKDQLEQLEAAQRKVKAYEDQLEEFHPGSCLPFGSTTGIYKIKLIGMESFYVPCDSRLAGSGWLVIQRRMDGSVNFYRNWTDYQTGFGSINGEFFLGLEKLHRLTAEQPYELYVHLEDFEDEIRYAHYDNFSIGSEKTFYELSSLGKYDGTAGNSMGLNVLQKFSTFDNDNDNWEEGSCAKHYHSAWWYSSCAAFCNPNGKYYKKRKLDYNSRGKGIIWQHWHGFEEALKFVQLMIRPVSRTNF